MIRRQSSINFADTLAFHLDGSGGGRCHGFILSPFLLQPRANELIAALRLARPSQTLIEVDITNLTQYDPTAEKPCIQGFLFSFSA